MGLAQEAGLEDLARQHLSVPSDKGANAGLRVASLVAGMGAGADDRRLDHRCHYRRFGGELQHGRGAGANTDSAG